MPQRRALHLRERVACRFQVAGVRRGLGDAGEGEGQHPDGVAVAQERGALAAEAQRRPDPSSREPDQAQRVCLDRRARRGPSREEERIGALRHGRRLGQAAGEPQRDRAHAEQHGLGVRQLVPAPAGDRQRRLDQRHRLVGSPDGEQGLDRAQRDGRPRPLMDRVVVQQRLRGGQGRLRAALSGRQPHPLRR